MHFEAAEVVTNNLKIKNIVPINGSYIPEIIYSLANNYGAKQNTLNQTLTLTNF